MGEFCSIAISTLVSFEISKQKYCSALCFSIFVFSFVTMDRKHNKRGTKRPSRPIRKKFRGNQFSDEVNTDHASKSAEKLRQKDDRSLDVSCNQLISYCFLNFVTVFATLQNYVKCNECNGNITFSQYGLRGLGFKLCVSCNCGERFIDSCPMIGSGYEVNRKFVFIMRLLGIGYHGIKLFCGMMDLGGGLYSNAYYKIIDSIDIAVTSVFDVVTSMAIDEEKRMNAEAGNPEDVLSVSGDGSWSKRGFSSLVGIVSLIGKYCGKVVDVAVRSSVCKACEKWKGEEETVEFSAWYHLHEEFCTANHEGSAGKMEVDGVVEMFLRSIEKFNVRYGYYIGDGDSKTFKMLLDVSPYGEELTVKKLECVLHVKKRLYKRAAEAKKNLKNFHKISTDENPQHLHCPAGATSWCEYRKREAQDSLQGYKHPPALDEEVEQILKPIYEDLTKSELLERCLGGNTQNNNESFNKCVWTMAPKHLFNGGKIVKIATQTAACIFNEGFSVILKIMDVLGVQIGPHALEHAGKRDNDRIQAANRRSSFASQEARTSRRDARMDENDAFELAEGLLYGAGIAD